MPDFPFGLEPPAAPAPGVGPTTTPGISRQLPGVFGFGLDTPFRRGASDFVAVGGLDLINANIAQILGTRAGSEYSTGELPWRSDFGSLLHRLRHQNNNAVAAELAKQYVVDAIARWEPRIRIVATTIGREKDADGNLSILTIKIAYVLRAVRNSADSEIYETSVTS